MASAFAGIEDSLSCSVCFVKYDSDSYVPKMLPCQHTFCGSCISHVNSRADEGLARCPVCRATIRSPADARTNLTVRDIVEALAKQTLEPPAAQPRAREDKMACAVHAGAEYIMFCADCCSPLCAHCMRLELKEGSHQGHDIHDIQEAKATIEKQLTSLVQQKIGKLKEKSSMLRNNLEEYQKEVNAVTSLMTEAIEGWRKDMLQDVPDKTRKAEEFDREAAHWHQQLKLTEFGDILKAFRDAKSDTSAEAEMVPPKCQLTRASIQELVQSVCVAGEKIETSLTQQATPPPTKQKGKGRGKQGTRGPRGDRAHCLLAYKSPSFTSLQNELDDWYDYPGDNRYNWQMRLKEVAGDVLAAPPNFTLVVRVGENRNTGGYRLLDYDMRQCPVHDSYSWCDERFDGLDELNDSFISDRFRVISSPCRYDRMVRTYYMKSSSPADIRAGLEDLKSSCVMDRTRYLAMPAFRDDQICPQDTRRIIQQVFADTSLTIILFYANCTVPPPITRTVPTPTTRYVRETRESDCCIS